MLLATTPFINFEKVVVAKNVPPRIISEIRKAEIGVFKEPRPRLSGELLVRCGNEPKWCPRKVSIRGGQLIVGPNTEITKSGSLRIPLRRLSVSAGPLTNSLSLIRGQNLVITIQTQNEATFDTWAKTIAIELIRQTPLEDIKYFDILTIDECWKRKNQDINANHVTTPVVRPNLTSNAKAITIDKVEVISDKIVHNPNLSDEIVDKPEINNNNRVYRRYMSAIPGLRYSCHKIGASTQSYDKLRTRSRSCNAVARDGSVNKVSDAVRVDQNDENKVEDLLRKCQNVESYVPVKEKLVLFETLCRLGMNVRSTENVSLKVDINAKRAKSLHDLSFNSAPVKEICRYFEKRTTEREHNIDSIKKDQRLIKSDSNLNRIRRTLLKT